MAKVVLTNITNLQNEQSVVNTINANNDAIEAAMELTLSRTNQTPNTMGTNLDMNSNRIYNLPPAQNPGEPVTIEQIEGLPEIEDLTQLVADAEAAAVASEAAADDAEYWAGVAQSAPIIVIGASYVSAHPTRTAAEAATIDPAIQTVITRGRLTEGDRGHAMYRKVVSDPSTPGAAFQSADGAWWSLVPNDAINAKVFAVPNDGVTDATATLQQAINYTSTRRIPLLMPNGSYLVGTVFIPSYTTIIGSGKNQCTFKVKNAHNATVFLNSNYNTTIAGGGGNFYIRLENFGIDANGVNQTSNFYPIAFTNVQDVYLKKLYLYNPYGTLLYISENDVAGTGPGGIPGGLQGERFNYRVFIEECEFDGTGQIETNADLNVVCRVEELWMARNKFRGGGANCIALQFNITFNFTQNIIRKFGRGLFVESCFNGEVAQNDFYESGTLSPLLGDAQMVCLWLAPASESYPGQAYQCSSYINVTGNRIRSINKVGGTSGGLIGIYVTAGYGGLAASGIRIHANHVLDLTATGSQGISSIRCDGSVVDSTYENNIIRCSGTPQTAGIYIGGIPYLGADHMFDPVITGNRIQSAYYPIIQASVGGHVGFRCVNNSIRGGVNLVAVANPGQPNYLNIYNN